VVLPVNIVPLLVQLILTPTTPRLALMARKLMGSSRCCSSSLAASVSGSTFQAPQESCVLVRRGRRDLPVKLHHFLLESAVAMRHHTQRLSRHLSYNVDSMQVIQSFCTSCVGMLHWTSTWRESSFSSTQASADPSVRL
jgi:hypothetical protein